MERTKRTKPQNSKYCVEEEPIVISKPTLDILLKQSNAGDLIALYTFYYYTAKWQKTNQPKSTTPYTAKGLGWSEDRVRKRKKILIQLKLIEDIEYKGEGNRITGHYVHVNFIWSKEKFHPVDFPQCGNNHSVEFNQGNALSIDNINALSTINSSTEEEDFIQLSYFEKFWRIYPKKVDKGRALAKWTNMCSQKKGSVKRPKWSIVKLAIQKQKKSERWQDPQFIPHPTTWLNQCRWLDDPKEMKSYTKTPEESSFQSSPEEILESHFKSDWVLKVMKDNYKQASKLISRNEEPELASNLCKLYDWIMKNQSSEVLTKVNYNINPSGLIAQYIFWLKDQPWIKDVTSKTFDPLNSLFQKMFLTSINKELNINVLTGKFIPSYESR